jgi:hypothetical protein
MHHSGAPDARNDRCSTLSAFHYREPLASRDVSVAFATPLVATLI